MSAPAKPTVTTQKQFDTLMAAAKGPVIVDFIQDGCGHCDDETPAFEKLLEDCKGSAATVMRVEISENTFGAELADKYKVDGTPTALLANSGDDFLAMKTREIADLASEKLRTKMKCTLPVKK